ncbi:hypothetical protein D1Z97_00365 [Riemerella anatipestifer]|nr:hypothetical protein [Riemerella anatipestifer]MRM99681.1 hypothetical protein [Riemerella anatipestifer]MRN01955.1 hypothetical protein [Riemerella anatipestifer]
MTRYISNIQTSVKKCHNYLVVPNNCVNTQVVSWVCVRLFSKFFRLLSLIINRVPPTFIGGFWYLYHSKFSFHTYLLKASHNMVVLVRCF